MAELVPQPFEFLLRRMAHELSHGSCFDLPSRSFHRPPLDLDFSARFHGERAASPLGPAAGPHSQLAQNLVLCYLAGARVLELKTVQLDDCLTIPRPCIDAATVGFNVEWSQELKLPQSLAEYLKAWVLIHALRKADLGLGLGGPGGELLFDLSVGYDLKGIQSPGVRAFLEGMGEARAELDLLFQRWPRDLLAWRPEREAVPSAVSRCVTLSTFHGCPAEEVERIGEHLLGELGTNLVVKLNPTLLGYQEVCEILQGRLGYQEIQPHRPAFEEDLRLEEALGLSRRLQAFARARGLSFGVKLSNTLVVENHRSFFPSEKVMYLSGQPLHVLTLELCRRFRQGFGSPLPVSFSAGVDARNFPDCVAAGFVPITTCTDLLRPGGYARLPRYLENLAARMRARGVSGREDFILAESGRGERVAGTPPAELAELVFQASLENHSALAQRALADPRYRSAQNRKAPRRLGTGLWLFDCVSCDKCVPVCPNDANFSLRISPELREARLPALVVRGGRLVEEEPRLFQLQGSHQLANYADLCNECGNCEVFCPEEGGPFARKPRFFSSPARLLQSHPGLDGFAAEREAQLDRLLARLEGQLYSLELDAERKWARFDDGRARLELSFPDFRNWRLLRLDPDAPEGHLVRLDRALMLAALLEGVFAQGASSPVNAAHLPAVAPPG